MSKRLIGLQLEIPPEDAIVACRGAIRSLEWELAESGEGRLTAREDGARLPCREWPAEIEVEVGAAPGERTMLTLAGFVPGRGPPLLTASGSQPRGAPRRDPAPDRLTE